MRSVAIVQSNYIPWKGYFDLAASVDELVLYDEVQYTKRDWRNRNIVKSPRGPVWLSVPVEVKGRYLQSIAEARIADPAWAQAHWRAIAANYAKAVHFEEVAALLQPFYVAGRYTFLSDLNRDLIDAIRRYLGIRTKLSRSADYPVRLRGRTERLVDICMQAGASRYVSGPAARAYLDEALFAARGIEVVWFEYPEYPVYPQLWGEFDHRVSIVDLLFNCGKEAAKLMKYVHP